MLYCCYHNNENLIYPLFYFKKGKIKEVTYNGIIFIIIYYYFVLLVYYLSCQGILMVVLRL